MIRFTAGATFIARGRRTHDDGSAYDIAGTEIRSSLIHRGVEYPLTITKHADPLTGRYTISCDASLTKTWPPGIYRWNVRYQDGDVVQVMPNGQPLLVRIEGEITP